MFVSYRFFNAAVQPLYRNISKLYHNFSPQNNGVHVKEIHGLAFLILMKTNYTDTLIFSIHYTYYSYSKTVRETTKNMSSATVKGPRTNQRPKCKIGERKTNKQTNCI